MLHSCPRCVLGAELLLRTLHLLGLVLVLMPLCLFPRFDPPTFGATALLGLAKGVVVANT